MIKTHPIPFMKDFGRSRRTKTLRLFVPAALVFAVTLTMAVGLYVHSSRVMGEKIREELRTAAALAAMRIPAGDLWTIDKPSDVTKPVFRDVAAILNDVRHTVPNARFVYIFRKTDDPKTVQFVVDADAVLTPQELDVNKNGKVDDNERAGLPGEPYSASAQPELQGPAFDHAVATSEYEDDWGPLITGLAPLSDHRYVLGIDVDAGEFLRLSRSVVSPAALMLIAFVAVLVAAYVAFYVWRRKAAEERRIASVRTNVVRLTMHQLGAPLAGMQWWLDLLKSHDTGPASEEKADAYRNMEAAIGRAKELIDALRRADTSAGGVDTSGVASLANVMRHVEEALSPVLTAKKQELSVDLGGCDMVRIQEPLLKGVMHELLENASTYSADNTSILVRAWSGKDGVSVSVSDSGCGIPADELPYIFSEFHRGKDASKYKAVGNGLGLFVTRNVIEAAGGDIGIKSEAGSGTTVTFTLRPV